MRVLIAGKSGQLAQEFTRQLSAPAFTVLAPDEKELDITNAETVRTIVGASRPDVVLNCAAYNLVDDAERAPGPAFAVNATGVANLAAACREAGAVLVHYGTDYVFGGLKETPYTEEDNPDPINAYGQSKLAGERLLAESMEDYLLLRVSWVFGDGRQNFLYKMLQAARSREVIEVVDDQVSIPTSTRDIVKYTMQALEKGLRGLYHLTNSGFASQIRDGSLQFFQAWCCRHGGTGEHGPLPRPCPPPPLFSPLERETGVDSRCRNTPLDRRRGLVR